jgi:FKBP-type peptidyl-prolyl cis-trans isomerase
MRHHPILFFLIFALCTCLSPIMAQEATRTTASGIEYTKLRQGAGEALHDGQIALLLLRQQLIGPAGDTLDKRNWDTPMPVVIAPKEDPVQAVLHELAVGDSVHLAVNITAIMPNPPPHLPQDATVHYYISVVGALADQAAFQAYQAGLEQQRMQQQAKIIEAYLQAKGMAWQRTSSGLYYVVLKEGNGQTPALGDAISVHYTGTLLDGTKFDSSHDRKKPFSFSVGMKQVIAGWDEGFALLSPGAKALLVLPSALAYGDRNMGAIKAHSILLFEVEFLENQGRP